MSNKKLSGGNIKPERGLVRAGHTLNLLGSTQTKHQKASGVSSVRDLRKASNSSRTSTRPISFGKFPTSGNQKRSSGSGSDWSNLLEKATSGGASKLLGSGILSFGLNSLFSSISDLFGGSHKNAPPPLQRFALPGSQEQTLYSTSERLSTTADKNVSSPSSGGSTYSFANNSVSQAAIVSAVKTALLTSSSLNDIIGEL